MMTSKDLLFVTKDGILDMVTVGPTPTTNDIWRFMADERLVIQLIGDLYQVYDLDTLRRIAPSTTEYTIGIPVFVTESYDAAVMWSLMNCGKEVLP